MVAGSDVALVLPVGGGRLNGRLLWCKSNAEEQIGTN